MCVIYHNPRCSKSRAALKILEDSGKNFKIIKYLESPPNKEELQNILAQTKLSAQKFIRSSEKIFTELNLSCEGEENLILAMIENPILIQRPIVRTNKGVRIGRPPENILEIL